MELRDFVVTPILILLIYSVAYFVRPYVTTDLTRRYFFPALTVRIFGAILLGLLYQFYYGGGDTFNYHTHGSRVIWEVIMDDPAKGFRLLSSSGNDMLAFQYSSQLLFLGDSSSFFVIQIATVFDLVTFSTYSATAVLFAIVSFIGTWLFFNAFVHDYPRHRKWIALAILFIPSAIFWGSGILKDSIVLACLGAITYCVKKIFIDRNIRPITVLLLILCVFVTYKIKLYVLLCFFPAALVWIYTNAFFKIRSRVLKSLIVPFFLMLIAVSGYYAVLKTGESDTRFALENLAKTAQISAYDIGFYSGRDAGSGYSLGELDSSLTGMLKLAPAAINVSLFRPYIWEVRNPLMLLSALESLVLLFFTIYILFKKRLSFLGALTNPDALFCLTFSLPFAFAVGISTFNFGTLARYKIPLLPFYALALIFLFYHTAKPRQEEQVLVE